MRSLVLYHGGSEEMQKKQSHFLDSCFLCSRPLSHNSDIFMYRGNTPFCSQDCRQQQMEKDEPKERKWKMASSSSSKRASTTTTRNSPDSKKDSVVRTGVVTVA